MKFSQPNSITQAMNGSLGPEGPEAVPSARAHFLLQWRTTCLTSF